MFIKGKAASSSGFFLRIKDESRRFSGAKSRLPDAEMAGKPPKLQSSGILETHSSTAESVLFNKFLN